MFRRGFLNLSPLLSRVIVMKLGSQVNLARMHVSTNFE